MMKWKILVVVIFIFFQAKVNGWFIRAAKNELIEEENAVSHDIKKTSSNAGTNLDVLDRIELINEKDGLFVKSGEPVVYQSDIAVRHGKHGLSNGNEKRNAVLDSESLWPRDIPYTFQGLSQSKIKIIRAAMKYLEDISCIRFHVRTLKDSNENFMKFIKGDGCFSYVGSAFEADEGGQEISVGEGCSDRDVVVHELLHALGFYHEQSRYDRDDYIEIFWENIDPDETDNFKKQTKLNTRNMATPYDYESIMHYGNKAFSVNGRDTLRAIDNPELPLGRKKGLTKIDEDSLNMLYHCSESLEINTWTQWSVFSKCHYFSDTKKCEKRRYRFCPRGKCACSTTCKVDHVACPDVTCRRDGHWGRWSTWSTCGESTLCGIGRKMRTRSCDNPSVLFGGKKCPGDAKSFTKCFYTCPRFCTFSENLCGYTVYPPTRIGGWERHNWGTPTKFTGPSSDVEGGAGYYVFVETTHNDKGDITNLLSPIFKASNHPQCYSWYYNMHGWTMGTLTVYIRVNGKDTEIWKKSRDQGKEWKRVRYDVTTKEPFQILFVYTTRGSYGDIGLDNLFLSNEPCVADVALNKPAKQSSTYPDCSVCDAKRANDGNMGTRSATNDNNQWWEVDLKDSFKVKRIVLYLYQYALNKGFYQQLLVSTRNKKTDSWSVYKDVGSAYTSPVTVTRDQTTNARYVRVTLKNNAPLYLSEVQVIAFTKIHPCDIDNGGCYDVCDRTTTHGTCKCTQPGQVLGLDGKTCVANIAFNKPAKQSSTYPDCSDCDAKRANDGDMGTRSATNDNNQWWEVDLKASFKVKRIVLYLYQYALNKGFYRRLLVSTRNKKTDSWSVIKNVKSAYTSPVTVTRDQTTNARYVRVTLMNYAPLYLSEVQVIAAT